ncbi:hypothetical protein CN326_16230 [Bacillus sp. AFS018417]|uniref:hypothetical protein n=1 Tax=unclassified Bacillus (in: firmicutes) TaxID=185979 RepID=UPI000BF8EF1F|nr:MULTISPECIES: hypothetical protein [unclassified Bacillus (in: firmicutes)]MCP1121991.1 hypothetical protein [Bacillus sp. 3103sda1]PEZ04581.1 hypothetical protein CN326_16230 [Bacillus sp. AFS018417]
MIGLLITEQEQKELEYVLKRELDELLFDFADKRIHRIVKKTMEERYKLLFTVFTRIAPPEDCTRYMRKRIFY